MQKNKKLLVAWIIFCLCVILFLFLTSFYFGSKGERTLSYQYRIIIAPEEFRKDSKITTDDETPKNIPDSADLNEKEKKKETAEVNTETGLYEKLPCGLVPKISPDGVRVLDAYSAKFQDEQRNRLYLVVLLNDELVPSYLSSVIQKIPVGKITFIVPQYSKNFSAIIDVIIKSGNEFFLQLPTQMSIPNSKQKIVSPFLANMNSAGLLDKLQKLLASTKYAIGIANTTSTLLTKSVKDMSIVTEELSKRGVAFLDLEKSNDVLQKMSENNSELVYIKAPEISQTKVSINDVLAKGIVSVSIDDLPGFLLEFSKQKHYILAPVSAMLNKAN